jgi:hypothetical protein
LSLQVYTLKLAIAQAEKKLLPDNLILPNDQQIHFITKFKYLGYVAGPLNAILWGCESWNLTKKNLNKLCSFHHGAIRRILSIKWQDVRDKHIKNTEVRALLFNIPNVDAFINRRIASYIRKISRSNEATYPS